MSMIPPISSAAGCSERYGTNRFLMQQQHSQHHHHQQLQQQQHPVPSSSPGCGIAGYYGSNQPRQCQQQQQPQQQQQHISLSRPQHPNNYMIGCFTQNPNGWAGVPLISTAARRPRKMHGYNNNNNSNNSSNNNNNTNIKQRLLISSSTEYDENAMSRLAIHAHGAPLILAGRYRNRVQKYSNVNNNNINNKQSNPGVGCSSNNHIKNKLDILDINTEKGNVPHAVGKNLTDSGSVASDESLSNGTTNTEACLPRIIKPRKRRKKDRKPQNGICMPDNTNVALNTSNNNHHHNHHHQQHHNQQETSCLINPYRIVEQNLTNNICPPSSYIEANNNILLPIDDYGNKTHLLPDDQNFGRIQQPLQDISSSTSLQASNCYCRLCDPSCRIWAFPLRRSCSDNSAEIEIQKNNQKDVGVIGSNRSWSSRNEWRSSLQIDSNITSCSSSSNNQDSFPSRNGSFSDSGDSGCDILGGINFADDLFNNNNNNSKNYNIISNNDIILPIPIGQEKDINNKKLLNANFPTAESLLTESINEISKKLMETVDLRSDIYSSDSSSLFSDSVLCDDVIFNLESLTNSATSLFCNNSNSENNNNNDNSGDISTIFDTKHISNDYDQSFIITTANNNNNISNSINFNNSDKLNKNFVMFHEKDRENEILNCFDMVWNGPKLLPIGRDNSAAV